MHTIRNIDLLSNPPKVCVPVFGADLASLSASCEAAKAVPFDVIEWRADFWTDLATLPEALSAVRAVLPEAPLLATFRTKREGGEQEISEDAYFGLLHDWIHLGAVDAVDVEYFHASDKRQAAIAAAKSAGIAAIVSSHDFGGTPEEGEMEALLASLVETGGIGKLAVMPHTRRDVLALLSATLAVKESYPDRPLITMAMGPLGVITRIAGETFGSALTFGAAKAASAPGQIGAGTLKGILMALHEE